MTRLRYVFLCWILGFYTCLIAKPKRIMLVLGSANLTVLEDRVAVATRLYRTQPIDKIIVSGGCGAHGSGICEASAMQQGLVARGVDISKIYKEENSKSTVQNYVFSRVLRDEHDQQIIQPGDTVFVVSDHWHAISVAARLRRYDHVIARFYIEGDLIPKETDKLDYGSIFNGQPDNSKFVLRGSWLTPEAVWSIKDSMYYLQNDLVYASNADNSSFAVHKAVAQLPFLHDLDSSRSRAFIDGGRYWWIRNGYRLLKVDKTSKHIVEERRLDEWIADLPTAWKDGAFSTGVFWNGVLLLFANEKVLVAKPTRKGFIFVSERIAGEYFKNWPFSWGKSNVSAAVSDKQTGQLTLFRNMESVRVDKELTLEGTPQPFRPTWIEELK